MCGIAGILLAPGATVEEETLRAMGETLRHRGPDDFSIFVRGNVGLSHNRLSILDLSSAGNQPYRNPRYVLSYNGEIYNYKELRKTLEGRGVALGSTSDTAVLFEYLVHFGVERTLKDLEGMFAFGFCDLEERTLYLCRDRLGIKPLVYAYEDAGLYWASEVKALAAVRKIRPDTVKTLLSATGVENNTTRATVFDGVWQVEPGTYLVCRPGKAPVSREYFHLAGEVDETYYRELDRMPESELSRELATLFDRSVSSMLMSDVPVGAFVSGGVDSSLVAARATHLDDRVSLYSANVVGRYSEYDGAVRLSRELGRPLEEVRFTPQTMLEDWARATYHYESPIIEFLNAMPLHRVAERARSMSVKPVLTGEGSDEFFWGYPSFFKSNRKFRREARARWLSSLPGRFSKLVGVALPASPASSMLQFLGVTARGFDRQRLRERCQDAYSFLDPTEVRRSFLTIQATSEVLVALLHRNDRMGMMASIESRFPFLDEKIIRFALNLPTRRKRRFSLKSYDFRHPFVMDKAPVRALARESVSANLAYKRKRGFPVLGHRFVRVSPGYFADGYVANELGLTSAAEDYMLRAQPPAHISKLVSIDIFGRIFGQGEAVDSVTRRVVKYVSVVDGNGR